MDSTIVLIVFQITAAICYSYHSLEDDEDYFDSSLSLTDIAERMAPRESIETNTPQEKRVFKVVPFTENKSWKKKLVPVPPEINDYNDIPIAFIIAAKNKIKDRINENNLVAETYGKGIVPNFGYINDRFQNTNKNGKDNIKQPNWLINVPNLNEDIKHNVSQPVEISIDGKKIEPPTELQKQIKANKELNIIIDGNTIRPLENETKIVVKTKENDIGKYMGIPKKILVTDKSKDNNEQNKNNTNNTKTKMTGDELIFKPKAVAVENLRTVPENKDKIVKNDKTALNKTAIKETVFGNKELEVKIQSKGETRPLISKCDHVSCELIKPGDGEPKALPKVTSLQKVYNLSFYFNK